MSCVLHPRWSAASATDCVWQGARGSLHFLTAFMARRFIAAFFRITFMAGAAAAAFMARRFIAAFFLMTFMAGAVAAFMARRFIPAFFFMTFMAFIAFMAFGIAGRERGFGLLRNRRRAATLE